MSLREILDELAGHVVQLVSEGSKDNLRSLFLLVEDVQTEIDNELKNAINTGFLESLQAETKLVGLDPELYIEFLGPHTKSWWNDLTKNWEASHDW